MCFLNALLFEHSPAGKGIPRDPQCEDAKSITTPLALLNALVAVACKAGILGIVTAIVSKEVCYQYSDWKRLATVHGWETREKIAILVGTLYLFGTASYVAVFLFMIPHYAASSYLQATFVSLAVIEIIKPFLQAVILTLILKSKYGRSFAAHFPQLSDFSHRHVMIDAEFTHAHWAELTRVLTSPTETEEKIGDDLLSETGENFGGGALPRESFPDDEGPGHILSREGNASADQPEKTSPDHRAPPSSITEAVMLEGADIRAGSGAGGQQRTNPLSCASDYFSCSVCVVDDPLREELSANHSRETLASHTPSQLKRYASAEV
jgi:hypothetical protein